MTDRKKTMFDLSGKAALISGGASGIGLAIAQAMLEQGAKVLIASRNQDKVEAAVKQLARATETDQIDAAAPIVTGTGLDVTSDRSVEAAVKRTVDLFGRIDILVNAAGVMLRKPTFELNPADFNQIYDTHVTGSLRCAKAAGHLMREQHSGCIINLASISSFVDLIEVAAYAAAKNAVLGLTRALANEWAKFGIRVNAIAPGFVPTDINRKMIENTDRGRRILEHTPMGRFGEAREIAGAAVFLASPAASFVNGHTLVVDGGYLASGIGDSTAWWTGGDGSAPAIAPGAE
ncbi:MAG: glucose 1-dehydrogenase [Phycisphaeraceae bacterium]|nr:glucose 1-dehydrogenase [Phycisphaeraceae bacterium]